MPTPTASEIIERVKARYAGSRTYQDEGAVSTTLVNAVHGRHTVLGIFHTVLERPFTGPIRFAYEYASQTTNKPDSLDFRVWTNQSSVYRSVGGRTDEVESVYRA